MPLHGDRALFELLTLEGAQAGLSWLTILRRRDGYRQVFDGFDPMRLAGLTDANVEQLLTDPRIIRNRAKVRSVRSNAAGVLALADEFGSFDAWLWSFVGGSPIQNAWHSLGEVPADTSVRDAVMRRQLLMLQMPGCPAALAVAQLANKVESTMLTPSSEGPGANRS